jgi:hypothetical protein
MHISSKRITSLGASPRVEDASPLGFNILKEQLELLAPLSEKVRIHE